MEAPMPSAHTVPNRDLVPKLDALRTRLSVGRLSELVEAVWCPIHGRQASHMRCEPGADETFELVFRPCCDALQAAIQRALAVVCR
jgi:hypothetical protein